MEFYHAIDFSPKVLNSSRLWWMFLNFIQAKKYKICSASLVTVRHDKFMICLQFQFEENTSYDEKYKLFKIKQLVHFMQAKDLNWTHQGQVTFTLRMLPEWYIDTVDKNISACRPREHGSDCLIHHSEVTAKWSGFRTSESWIYALLQSHPCIDVYFLNKITTQSGRKVT